MDTDLRPPTSPVRTPLNSVDSSTSVKEMNLATTPLPELPKEEELVERDSDVEEADKKPPVLSAPTITKVADGSKGRKKGSGTGKVGGKAKGDKLCAARKDIIDGFAITSFKTMVDLQAYVQKHGGGSSKKKTSRKSSASSAPRRSTSKTSTSSTAPPLPLHSVDSPKTVLGLAPISGSSSSTSSCSGLLSSTIASSAPCCSLTQLSSATTSSAQSNSTLTEELIDSLNDSTLDDPYSSHDSDNSRSNDSNDVPILPARKRGDFRATPAKPKKCESKKTCRSGNESNKNKQDCTKKQLCKNQSTTGIGHSKSTSIGKAKVEESVSRRSPVNGSDDDSTLSNDGYFNTAGTGDAGCTNTGGCGAGEGKSGVGGDKGNIKESKLSGGETSRVVCSSSSCHPVKYIDDELVAPFRHLGTRHSDDDDNITSGRAPDASKTSQQRKSRTDVRGRVGKGGKEGRRGGRPTDGAVSRDKVTHKSASRSSPSPAPSSASSSSSSSPSPVLTRVKTELPSRDQLVGFHPEGVGGVAVGEGGDKWLKSSDSPPPTLHVMDSRSPAPAASSGGACVPRPATGNGGCATPAVLQKQSQLLSDNENGCSSVVTETAAKTAAAGAAATALVRGPGNDGVVQRWFGENDQDKPGGKGVDGELGDCSKGWGVEEGWGKKRVGDDFKGGHCGSWPDSRNKSQYADTEQDVKPILLDSRISVLQGSECIKSEMHSPGGTPLFSHQHNTEFLQTDKLASSSSAPTTTISAISDSTGYHHHHSWKTSSAVSPPLGGDDNLSSGRRDDSNDSVQIIHDTHSRSSRDSQHRSYESLVNRSGVPIRNERDSRYPDTGGDHREDGKGRQKEGDRSGRGAAGGGRHDVGGGGRGAGKEEVGDIKRECRTPQIPRTSSSSGRCSSTDLPPPHSSLSRIPAPQPRGGIPLLPAFQPHPPSSFETTSGSGGVGGGAFRIEPSSLYGSSYPPTLGGLTGHSAGVFMPPQLQTLPSMMSSSFTGFPHPFGAGSAADNIFSSMSASAANQEMLTRVQQELNTRFLQDRGLLPPLLAATAGALPQAPFTLHTEMHQHLHHHQHLLPAGTYLPTTPQGSTTTTTLKMPLSHSMFRHSQSLSELAEREQLAKLSMMSNFPGFSSFPGLSAGLSLGSGVHGAFQPKSTGGASSLNLAPASQLLQSLRDREQQAVLAAAAVPPTLPPSHLTPASLKKRGRWCAAHVRIAGLIQEIKQLQRSDRFFPSGQTTGAPGVRTTNYGGRGSFTDLTSSSSSSSSSLVGGGRQGGVAQGVMEVPREGGEIGRSGTSLDLGPFSRPTPYSNLHVGLGQIGLSPGALGSSGGLGSRSGSMGGLSVGNLTGSTEGQGSRSSGLSKHRSSDVPITSGSGYNNTTRVPSRGVPQADNHACQTPPRGPDTPSGPRSERLIISGGDQHCDSHHHHRHHRAHSREDSQHRDVKRLKTEHSQSEISREVFESKHDTSSSSSLRNRDMDKQTNVYQDMHRQQVQSASHNFTTSPHLQSSTSGANIGRQRGGGTGGSQKDLSHRSRSRSPRPLSSLDRSSSHHRPPSNGADRRHDRTPKASDSCRPPSDDLVITNHFRPPATSRPYGSTGGTAGGTYTPPSNPFTAGLESYLGGQPPRAPPNSLDQQYRLELDRRQYDMALAAAAAQQHDSRLLQHFASSAAAAADRNRIGAAAAAEHQLQQQQQQRNQLQDMFVYEQQQRAAAVEQQRVLIAELEQQQAAAAAMFGVAAMQQRVGGAGMMADSIYSGLYGAPGRPPGPSDNPYINDYLSAIGGAGGIGGVISGPPPLIRSLVTPQHSGGVGAINSAAAYNRLRFASSSMLPGNNSSSGAGSAAAQLNLHLR